MIKYQLFPRSRGIEKNLQDIIDVFVAVDIMKPKTHLKSNEMLSLLRPGLELLGFSVEKGKRKGDLIPVPVLFGEDNEIDKSFFADAQSLDRKIVIEVEAGRAVANNQFLKDIFQACMMFEVEHLVIAVLNEYGSGKKKTHDFQTIKTFLETLYISNRLYLPLKSILLIGY